MADDFIAGRNPVLEALRAGRSLNKVWVARGATQGPMHQIRQMARAAGVPVQEVERAHLDSLAPGTSHQGVVAGAAAWEYVEVDDILARAQAAGEAPLVMVLDGIEDPHNLGSIVRTCEAAGVHGVIIPQRRAVGLTPVVAKASAGAVEYMPVARVTNITRTLTELKARGLWICGAHQDAPEVLHQARLTGPLALVIGGEGRGLGRLVTEACDFHVRIPMVGRVGSLNAAVAAAILVFEVIRQRQTGDTAAPV